MVCEFYNIIFHYTIKNPYFNRSFCIFEQAVIYRSCFSVSSFSSAFNGESVLCTADVMSVVSVAIIYGCFIAWCISVLEQLL